jgi:two-component system OmpR family sensor kinase
LSQMVANLVENAIKYAGGRGRHVRIETGRREAWAWVSVEDDGPGIPAEYLPHLFDRFYRVDKARTRQADQAQAGGVEKPPDGSGLGLSIVQWVARAHGGEVTVTSEVGKGARFEARLPLSKI